MLKNAISWFAKRFGYVPEGELNGALRANAALIRCARDMRATYTDDEVFVTAERVEAWDEILEENAAA